MDTVLPSAYLAKELIAREAHVIVHTKKENVWRSIVLIHVAVVVPPKAEFFVPLIESERCSRQKRERNNPSLIRKIAPRQAHEKKGRGTV